VHERAAHEPAARARYTSASHERGARARRLSAPHMCLHETPMGGPIPPPPPKKGGRQLNHAGRAGANSSIARARRASAPRPAARVAACVRVPRHESIRQQLRGSKLGRGCASRGASARGRRRVGGNVLGAAAGSTARQRPRWPRRDSLCRDSTGGRACARSISRLAAICGQEGGGRDDAPDARQDRRKGGEYWAPNSAGF